MLEIEKERQSQAGCLQVAEALGQMRGREAIDAFQLDDQHIFNYRVRVEFSNEPPLVSNGIGDLGDRRDTPKG